MSGLQQWGQVGIVCRQSLSLRAEHSQLLSCRPWQQGTFVPCCLPRLVRGWPRDGIESWLRAGLLWHSKPTWQISDSPKVRSSAFSLKISTEAEFRILGLATLGITECTVTRAFMPKIHIFENSHVGKLNQFCIVKIHKLLICCILLQPSG